MGIFDESLMDLSVRMAKEEKSPPSKPDEKDMSEQGLIAKGYRALQYRMPE